MRTRVSLFVLIIAAGLAGVLLWMFFVDDKNSKAGTSGEDGELRSLWSVVVEGLEIPWDVAFLPDGRMLVTERVGRLSLFSPNGTFITTLLSDRGVHLGEGGLLGVAVHPLFDEQGFVYLYVTEKGEDGATINSVWQYWLNDRNELLTPAPLITDIPGAPYHDGGRIAFGPDGFLYITTGDATRSELAQDIKSPAGKILRIDARGGVPESNPFGTAVYSYGHRNPQGLTWDEDGRLWSTEHGRSGIRSGLDELNLIKAGENYGWPESEGGVVRAGTVAPVAHSGPLTTWAPASALYYKGSIFFGGLRGEALYEAILRGDTDTVGYVREHFKGVFGRIRTVTLGPDGFFYLTTSNRDGRGKPKAGDDKIIRIHPQGFTLDK